VSVCVYVCLCVCVCVRAHVCDGSKRLAYLNQLLLKTSSCMCVALCIDPRVRKIRNEVSS